MNGDGGGVGLGVRTARGDFERALVSEVVRAVERLGCSCWACARGERSGGALHRLMSVEDAHAMVSRMGQEEGK